MRTFCFIFLSVAYVAFMPRTGYVAFADDTKHQQNENESANPPARGRTADNGHSTTGPSSSVKAKGSQQPAKNPSRLATGNTKIGHQPLVNPANGTVNRLPGKNGSANKARSAQPSPASRMSAPASIGTPHHSPNPASVGGSTLSATRNIAAINGTSMRRKP
jgi:hypothetical protein